MLSVWIILTYGSSPRVRGTVVSGESPPEKKRFIPACAGNSAPRSVLPRQPPVHPRVCGEQCSTVCFAASASGSSPRVRGTVVESSPSRGVGRFIPACAGNRKSKRTRCVSATVHPRVCGEQCPTSSTGQHTSGSSPRVRGTVLVGCFLW